MLRTVMMNSRMLLLVLRGGAATTSLLVTLVIGRAYGAAILGQFALATLTANLLANLAIAGMDGAMIRMVSVSIASGAMAQARGQVVVASRMVFATTTTAAGLLLTASFWLDVKALAIAAMACPAIGMTRLLATALRASGDPAAPALLAGTLPSLTLLAMLPLLGSTVNALATAFTGGWWVAVLSAWATYRARLHGPATVDRSTMGALLRAGLPIGLATISDAMTNWAVLTIVASALGAAEAGGMRVAMQLIGVVGLVLIAADDALAPRLAVAIQRDDQAGADDLLEQTRRWSLCLAGPMLLVFAAIPARVLDSVGSGLDVGAPALRWLAVLNLASVFVGPAGTALAMGAAPRRYGELALAGLLVGAALGFALIPILGVAGAGIALGGVVFLRRWLGRRTFTANRRPAM